MENGDLATWASSRIIVVLEGMLVRPTYAGRLRKHLVPAEEWAWQSQPLKHLWDYTNRQNLAVEVVTFLSEEVCDEAADWMSRYDVPAAAVDYADLDWFCRSLTWRPEVTYVVDSDPVRFRRYGQKGFAATFGGEF